MATIVQAAKDPWWANLAVNVLGGLWNDYQQREANKKANAYYGELMNQLHPTANDTQQSGGLLTTPAQQDSSNGWESAFQKTDSTLPQFDKAVTGLLGASASPTATTAPTPTPQAAGLPTPMDIYRAAMGLAATKRFAMMNPDTIQNMITPYMKLNEAARQEQMRNDLARDYESATDAAGRKNVAARGLINQTIDQGAFGGLVGANAVTPMNLDLGGSILPGMFDAWSGKMIYGDKWDKSLTPQQVADNAYRDRAFAEDIRRNNRDFTENNSRWWTTRGDSRVDADRNYGLQQRQIEQNETTIKHIQLMPDGHVYGITQNGEAKRLSTMPGLTDIQKETLNRKEERIKTLTKMREGLVSNRNVYVNKGVDTADLDKQITEIDAEIEKTNGEIQSIVNTLGTQDSGLAGQKMTISVNYETLKNNYNRYKTIIDDNAKKNNVDPELITAIIQVESNWKPHAVSGAGARGMMQLMPKTARYVGVNNSYDATQNIAGGTKYIAEMLRRYDGNIEKALWAYNAGPGNADKGRMPAETRKYIANVMGIYSQLMGWRDAPELKPNTFVGVDPYDDEKAAMATVEGRRKAAIPAYQNPDTGETVNQLQLEILERNADKGEKYKNREELYKSLHDNGYVRVDNNSTSNLQSQTDPTSNNDKFQVVEQPTAQIMPPPLANMPNNYDMSTNGTGINTPTVVANTATSPVKIAVPTSAQVADPLDMRPSYMKVNMPYARSYTKYPGEIPSINPSSSISFVRPQTQNLASLPSNATIASTSTPFVNPLGSNDIPVTQTQVGLTTPSEQENAEIQKAMTALNYEYNTWDEAYRQRYPFASMSESWGV